MSQRAGKRKSDGVARGASALSHSINTATLEEELSHMTADELQAEIDRIQNELGQSGANGNGTHVAEPSPLDALDSLPPPSSSSAAQSSSATTEVYCICRQPYDANKHMIACDSCDEW